jgi:hypothetical protein
MDLNKIKEEFIDSTKEGSKASYSRKIQVFTDYLSDRCSVNEFNSKETLRGIGTDKILESIEYYVENYGIAFKSTVDGYVTVIKSYFLFIAKEYNIHNDNFDSNAKIAILDDLISKKAEQLNLNKTKMKDPISDDEFKLLLDSCDDCIQKFELDDYSNDNKYNGDSSTFISAVIMKLVMYTGIKNAVISTIKKRDYNYDLNQIKINGLWLDLPNKLAIDLKKFSKLRNVIITQRGIIDKDEYQLFTNSKGDYMSKVKSDEIYKIMSQELNSTEGEALCKNVIMKHIEAGINIIEIMNLTTFSIKTCEHCKELLNEKLDRNRNKYINTKLRGSLLYEIL